MFNDKKQYMKTISLILLCFVVLIETAVTISLMKHIRMSVSGGKVLGNVDILPMSRAELSFPESKRYAYFYELPEDAIATESARWLPYKVSHQYNHDGLNDVSNYEITRPPTTFRIITLGDSFTFGMWVPTQENYSEKLEQMLNKRLACPEFDRFEVLNMGVPGYDIAYSAERFRRRGTKYDPDLLLWYVRDDDFFIINEEFYPRVEFYKNELQATGAAERYGAKVEDPNGPVNLAYEEVYGKNEGFDEAGRREYTKVEREALHEFLSAYPRPVTVFTFFDTPEEYKSYIQEAIRGLSNVSYFDKIENVETFHPYDYHPTAKGHMLIAEALYNYLKTSSKFLASCRPK